MALAEQWSRIESGLQEAWADVRLCLTVDGDTQCDRAAALLGPFSPGRCGAGLRLTCSRRGGPGPQALRRCLRMLDAEGIGGTLELLAAVEATPVVETPRRTLVEAWDAEVGALPADWSDVYAEIELASSDCLDRTALLCAPLNPYRKPGTPGFRFRCASSFGYGASERMVRRCLGRVDEDRIAGEVRILRSLSDTKPVGAQGPVWLVGGKVV